MTTRKAQLIGLLFLSAVLIFLGLFAAFGVYSRVTVCKAYFSKVPVAVCLFDERLRVVPNNY